MTGHFMFRTDFLTLVVGVVCPKAVALIPKHFIISTVPKSTLFVKVFPQFDSLRYVLCTVHRLGVVRGGMGLVEWVSGG